MFAYSSFKFQTKLTYGMICYIKAYLQYEYSQKFQTKLTYGMICYCLYIFMPQAQANSFKLS